MSSIIKVNTYQDANGNALFSSDGSGNVTLNSNFSGVLPSNTPSFLAYRGSGQSIAHNTNVILQYTATHYDTHSAFDTSTYKFTVPNGHDGKYYLYANHGLEGTAPSRMLLRIKLNGTTDICAVETGNDGPYSNIFVATVRTLVAGDYLQATAYHDKGSANITTSGLDRFYFGGYKLIGA